jgi:hypothetical protein
MNKKKKNIDDYRKEGKRRTKERTIRSKDWMKRCKRMDDKSR